MKYMVLFVAVFLCLWNTHVYAVEETSEATKRFQLFNNCQQICLTVHELSDNAVKLGLTRKSIQNATEIRLRSAHLYDNRPLNSCLSVGVYVFEQVFLAELGFRKRIFDRFSDHNGLALTWRTGKFERHGNRSELIMSHVSRLIDQFLVEFLRVNDEACRKKRKDLK